MDPKKIKELRQKFGWSQERLARELGMSFCTVNRWEQGKAHPSPMAMRGLRRLEEHGEPEESRKRIAFRLQTHCPIEVRFRSSETMDDSSSSMPFLNATTENLSSIGLMFRTQANVTEGKTLSIGWNFGRDKYYEVLSRVIWTKREQHEQSVGVRFDHPMPNVISNVLDSLITQ